MPEDPQVQPLLFALLVAVKLIVYDLLAVFDQYATKRGLKPSIPEGVGLAFPRRNRMLLFKGNRFHGVLVWSLGKRHDPSHAIAQNAFYLASNHIVYVAVFVV